MMAASLLAAASLFMATPTAAQSIGQRWNFDREACPPGQRVPVSLADTTLHVELRWVTSVWLGDFPAPTDACPTTPFRAKLLYFYYDYKELARLYKDRGLPLKSLILEAGAVKDIWRLPFPAFSERKRAVGSVGFVEDVTERVVVDRRPVVRSRAYVIQHSNTTDDSTPVLVVCSGTPKSGANRRDCETEYSFEPGLIVRYEVRQDARDLMAKSWDIPPSGPIEEPDGLLEIDRKVRELIRFLKSQP